MKKTLALILGLSSLMATALHAETLSVMFGGSRAATYGGVAVSPDPTQDNSNSTDPIVTVTGLDIDGIGTNDDSVVVAFSVENSTENARLLSGGYRYDPGDLLTFNISSASISLGNGETTTHQIDITGFTSVGNNTGATKATVTSTDPGFTVQTNASNTISLTNDLPAVSNFTLENTSTANGRAREIVAAFNIGPYIPVAPASSNNTYECIENTVLTEDAPGVLANDTDVNGDPLSAILVTSPSNGVLTAFAADGSFVYQPNADFTGTDSFTYQATDGGLTGNVATVTINVVDTPVTFPFIFQNNMVLQRNEPIPVWGWGKIGDTVTVSLSSGQTDTAIVDALGRWEVTLEAMTATNGPLTLTVNAPGSSASFTNLAVGDVWFFAGQSNAGWALAFTDGATAELATANYPNFRLVRTPRLKLNAPTDDPIDYTKTQDWDKETDAYKDKAGKWFVCSPATAGYFGATFYYAGKEIHLNTGVPVGIIQSAFAGTPVEAWANSPLPLAHAPGADPASAQQLYNAMVYPFTRSPITGAGWYQGERNHGDPGHIYADKLSIMINDWRTAWNKPDLPFYYLQIPPVLEWNTEEDADPQLPFFWEAQTHVMDLTSNAYMVVVSDTTDGTLHPKNKAPGGQRMGTRILKNTYGFSHLQDSGPIFDHAVIEDDQMRLHFNEVGGGLAINTSIGYNLNGDDHIHSSTNGVPDSGEDLNTNGILDPGEDVDGDGILDLAESDINFTHLTWFELLDSDGNYTNATAVIDGDTVVLSAPSVTDPIGFRYASSRFAQGNLMNVEGLPLRLTRYSPPIAHGENYKIHEGTSLYVEPKGILDNDVIGSDLLPFQSPIIIIEPSNGTLMVHANGSLIYEPNTGFSGSDSFTYAVSDGEKTGTEATVNIEVYAAGSANGQINRDVWTKIEGARVGDLTSSSNYPHSPNLRGFINALDAPQNWAENYGQRIYGYLHPPTNGNYMFFISSSARSDFRLSTDESPSNVVTICASNESQPGEWTAADSPVTLVGGQRYFLEIRHKEKVAADHVQVAWDLAQPGMGITNIIDGTYLSGIPFAAPATGNYADWSSWHDVSGDEFLLDFAFNLEPSQNSGLIMTPTSGTTGLPYWELPEVGGGARVEYLRRKNAPGTTYTVQFSDNLMSNWVSSSSIETVSSINGTWERVTVEDDVNIANATNRFGRVIVIQD